jgi:hypothetical protein
LTGTHAQPRFETIMRIAHAAGERVGWVCGEEGFSLDDHQRAKVRTVAGILMDMTRSNSHNQKQRLLLFSERSAFAASGFGVPAPASRHVRALLPPEQVSGHASHARKPTRVRVLTTGE